MNGPGLLELIVIVFLGWVFLGPQKMTEGARALGKAYSEFRGHTVKESNLSEKDLMRSSAERLGINTEGMNQEEIKTAMMEKLSNE